MSEAVPEAAGGGAQRLFSPKIVLIMLAVGVFCFAAFMVLSAYAPDLKTSSDGGEHALSRSAVGYGGLAELLKAQGEPLLISRGPIRAGRTDPGVLILTPGVETNPEEIAKLKFDGPTLLVLPKWVAIPHPTHLGWVRKLRAAPPEMALASLTKLAPVPKPQADASPADSAAPGQNQAQPDQADAPVTVKVDLPPAAGEADASGPAPALPSLGRRKGVSQVVLSSADELFPDATRIALPPIDQLQTLSGPGWSAVLVDEQNRAVLARRDGTNLYVLSDPDLLNTQGLKSLAGARAATAVIDGLRGEGGPVILDVTLHGFKRGRNLLRLAFEPPFVGLTLCLLAVAGLMGWHAAARFGAPPAGERAFALGKRALADNSAALIKLARREHRMAPGYAALERNAVARLVGAPRNLAPEELDAFLDRLGAARGVSLRIGELLAQAQIISDAAGLMALAEKLHRWRLEMTRERH